MPTAPPSPSPPLVRLRIPPGWAVTYNRFAETTPHPDPQRPDRLLNWSDFTQDLLQIVRLTHREGRYQTVEPRLLLDLGWYPDGQTDGAYRLVLVWNDQWEPLRQLSSANIEEVRDTLEAWMADPALSRPEDLRP